jgi:hypothetical protein
MIMQEKKWLVFYTKSRGEKDPSLPPTPEGEACPLRKKSPPLLLVDLEMMIGLRLLFD